MGCNSQAYMRLAHTRHSRPSLTADFIRQAVIDRRRRCAQVVQRSATNGRATSATLMSAQGYKRTATAVCSFFLPPSPRFALRAQYSNHSSLHFLYRGFANRWSVTVSSHKPQPLLGCVSVRIPVYELTWAWEHDHSAQHAHSALSLLRNAVVDWRCKQAKSF